MSDCPHCEWRYDPMAEPIVAKLMSSAWPPVIWDGERLRQAWGFEAPDGYRAAAAHHICSEHWLEPEVIALGPVRFTSYAPAA